MRAALIDHVAANVLLVTNGLKYVNMADINFRRQSGAPGQPPTGTQGGGAGGKPDPAGEPVWDVIELLFFAYRDFVGDPDHELESFGFGRAHHRVLHFVHRNPGLKVAALLEVLRITKQSLGRVLKQLIDEGYIVQQTGANDRRQRLLFATPKGETLVLRLVGLQSARIRRAMRDLDPAGREVAKKFLRGMIDPQDRDKVLQAILKGVAP
jgi:DNA-binding MarR family transcriptional regulator